MSGSPGWGRSSASIWLFLVDAFLSETLLPAPDAGIRFPHDIDGSDAIGGEKDDFAPPNRLLGSVAIPEDGLQPPPMGRSDFEKIPLRMLKTRTHGFGTGSPTGFKRLEFNH
jgi:hypothetical protein